MADRYWRGGTGTWNGTNTANWASTSAAATFTASRAAAVLDVTAVASGTIAVGDTVWHTNGTSIGTITSFGTGSGGTGTYNMSASGAVTSRTMSSATVGATVPAAADNVIFDANSNVGTATFTVTAATATALCTDFTASGLDAAMTFAGSIGLTISGSLSLPASNFTRTFTGAITFNSTTSGKTITTNGVTFASAITFNGVGGVWTLGTNVTTTGAVTLTNGTLALSTFTLQALTFASNNANTRTLSFGTGKIVLTGNAATIWTTSTVTGLTVSGTPLVECTYAAGTGTRTITTGALSEANSISFSITAGTDIVALTSAAVVRNLIFTGFAGTHTLVATTLYGDLTFSTGMTVTGAAVTHTHAATSGTKTITSNGKSYDCSITYNGVGGTWRIADNLTATSTRTSTLTNGSLNLQTFTYTTGIFNANNSNTRSITLGTGAKFILTGSGATIWAVNTATNLTISGTLRLDCTYSGAVGTRTINNGGTGTGSAATAPDVYVTAGTDTVTFSADPNAFYGYTDFTGFAGTWTTGTFNMTEGVLFSTGMTISAGGFVSFTAASGTHLITTNGKTLDFPITFNGAGTWQLQDAMTVGATRTLTLTAGTINLQTFTLTTGLFASSNSNTRSLTFGTGSKIVVTSSGTTVWSMATATGFTVTGTPRVEFTYSGGVGTRTISHGNVGGTEANSISVYVTAGTDITAINTAIRILDFTGFSGSLSSANRTIYGNLVLSSTMTVTSGAQTTTFGATSGTQQITTNGVSFGQNFYVSAPGATVQLQDALIVDSARSLSLVDGTLDTNDLSVSCGSLAVTGSNTRTLDFGSSDITVLGSGATAVNANVITGLTISYTAGASVIMSSASAKTFVGGGASWPALVQGGAGDLTITGSNTFADISNTTQPVSVLFTAGTTSTFADFSLSGTLGNLVTIGSATAASHALSKSSGIVSVEYCTISRSDAAGGATWNASTSFGNVDGGNNTGWNFASASATTRPLNVGMVNAGVATLDQFSAGTAFMGWGN